MDTEIPVLGVPVDSPDRNDPALTPQQNGSVGHPATLSTSDPRDRPKTDVDFGSALTAAMASQRWLVAVWHIEHDQVFLFRQINGFPTSDLDVAQQLLRDDLRNLGQAS